MYIKYVLMYITIYIKPSLFAFPFTFILHYLLSKKTKMKIKRNLGSSLLYKKGLRIGQRISFVNVEFAFIIKE